MSFKSKAKLAENPRERYEELNELSKRIASTCEVQLLVAPCPIKQLWQETENLRDLTQFRKRTNVGPFHFTYRVEVKGATDISCQTKRNMNNQQRAQPLEP
jgi:hypothetical protein